MFRRAACLLHLTTIISKTSYVSIFPIHLDPPTLQHREIFKLLLNVQEEPSKEQNTAETSLSSSNEASTGLGDEVEKPSEAKLVSEDTYSRSPLQHSPLEKADMNSPQQRLTQQHQSPSSPLVQPKYAYMEPFARSIQNHSQLAPFEDIILVPNTRYPISLAQSTNLAALAVLAVRGLPHVHVDFTALEHPDASMPIIYELTQRYPNCVLVHWLHDAYEMQRWKNFSIIKLHVPLMLLKTISLPVPMFAKPPYSSPNDFGNSDCVADRHDNAKVDAQGSQFQASDSPFPDKNLTTGQGLKTACTYKDKNNPRLGLKADSQLSDELGNSKAIAETGVEGNRTTTAQNFVSQGEWWLNGCSHDDDNIEVSKSYYNSGSFSWLGFTPHMNSMVGWDNVNMVEIDPHHYTHGPCSREHGVLKSATNPWHEMKNSKAPDTHDNGGVNAAIETKDVFISEDGFVKVVDEGCKISDRGASYSMTSTSDCTEKGNTTGRKTGRLSSSVLESILHKMPSSLTSSTPTLSALKELAQVKHELSDIFSASVLPSSPETFQPFGKSYATSAHDIQNSQYALHTENKGPQIMKTNGWDAQGDSRNSEHREKTEQLRSVPFQNAQRNVRELLEELYQPLNYHQSYNHPTVMCPTDPCKKHKEPVNLRKSGTSNSKGNPSAEGNSFTDSGKGGSAQMDHAKMSEGGFTGVPIDTSSSSSSGCGHDTLPSAAESRRLPVVEVHSVIRTTGADVRQALWEQEIDPIHMLSDCVLRYINSYMLYSDSRKNKANDDLKQYQPRLPSSGFLGASPAVRSTHIASADVRSARGARRFPLSKTDNCVRSSQRKVARVLFENIIPRLELHYDKNNPIAREKYDALKIFQVLEGEEPDLIVPIGGDGYMMHCIRKNWRRFIPFYGVNAGRVGYLLNDCSALEDLFTRPLMMNSTNMLYCQAEREAKDSERVFLSEMAFNDAWVERSSGQSALIRILVNGEEQIKGLRADGVLVSTAAGSTAYSRAAGASPIPVGVPLIQVVGSNVVSPSHWRPVHLNQEDVVEFEVLDHGKRPCRCFVDAVNLGNIVRMQVRSSRVAGVTLVFSNSCDLQQKLFQMQFPKMD